MIPVEPIPRHARCLAALRRVAWDVERDLIRARQPDLSRHFVPDALSRVAELGFLRPPQARALSQLQACTYAHCAVLVERCVAATALLAGENHWLGDALSLQAHLRVADNALKHQRLFRRLAQMTTAGLPPGYRFTAGDDALARAALRRSRWAALALALALVLAAQAHYRHSLEAAEALCPLWRDVFLFHWKEASQHAVMVELAWQDEQLRTDAAGRERGSVELIGLLDELALGVQRQADADAEFFVRTLAPGLAAPEADALRQLLHRAYRRQFVGSGLQEPRFLNALQKAAPGAPLRQMSAHFAPWTSEI
jgi:hypothetical protein